MNKNKGRTRVIGIAGGSASGKSTFSNILAGRLTSAGCSTTALVFHMDDYYLDKSKRPTFRFSFTGREMWDYDNPDAFDHLRLVSDIRSHTGATDDVVIVEGLMVLFHESIRDLLDLKLFIDLEVDERALRRLLRDMSGHRIDTDPEYIACFYRECARVGHTRFVEPSRAYADLTFRGDADFTRISSMIAAIITADGDAGLYSCLPPKSHR